MVNAEILNRKDPLTGFHTKEGLNEYLTSKMTAVYEKVQRLTVILIDLDNFKRINDHYGHLVGDDALRHFSMVINKALQGRHFVARYGGDEFVIVIVDTPDGKESLNVAYRFRVLLAKERFYTSRNYIRINSSIGMASFPYDEKTARGLLETADGALYYAKKHGRNRIVTSRSLKTHFIRDKVALLVKITVVVVFVATAYFAYAGTDSLRGVVAYYKNILQYMSYRTLTTKSRGNFYYLDLKNGSKIEGWAVAEDSNSLLISIKRPALVWNPIEFKPANSIQTIRVPKSEIVSSVRITKQ